MRILVLNSGSSSQKSRLYDLAETPPARPPRAVWKAEIAWEDGVATMQVHNGGTTAREQLTSLSRRAGIERILATLWRGKERVLAGPGEIDVVGHRVVHGGAEYDRPVRVTADVKAAIARLSAFAPLHNRAELDEIEVVERVLGEVLQVVVFDTAFHRRLPLPAAVFPGPYEWLDQGIRRYGFHGINHEYCAERAAQLLGRDLASLRLVTCHLGNGCSLAAVRDGRSIDTTMGFTPLDGLMMGTRSGSVDPGILTYLLRQGGVTGQQLDSLLNTKSGLLGVSGMSADMRQILAARREGHARATLVFDVYVHRLRSCIGAMVGVLGGVDALVFTAGVGEHAAEVRAAACDAFGFLGLKLDHEQNAQSPAERDIARPDSTVRVLIVPAEEEWAIARACWRLATHRAA
jgi:acetate kinase